MDAAAKIPEHLRGEFMQSLEEMQIRDQFKLYTRLGEHCFRDCVSTFRSKTLDATEEKCVNNCATMFLKMSKRVGERFSENQMQEQQAQMQMMQTPQ
mmetsp:Transcript_6618/g.12221  ORF Transcript_6618/g.12221 Transcript_6618/m.12221 type:complete len:97 (+) Transcript_6618:134-424(+)